MTDSLEPRWLDFVYGDLNPSDAAFIRDAAHRIREHGRRFAHHAVAIGRELIAVKKLLRHGQFGQWLAGEFSMSQSTAENFMNAARLVERKPKFWEFGGGISVLYKLAAPNTPDEVREGVLAGTIKPTIVAVQRAITEHRTRTLDPNMMQALHRDMIAASPRHVEMWRTVVEQSTPPSVREMKRAFSAFLALWNLTPDSTVLAGMLLDLMGMPDVGNTPPDVHTLARGLSQRPRWRVIATQWVTQLQAALDQAAAM